MNPQDMMEMLRQRFGGAPFDQSSKPKDSRCLEAKKTKCPDCGVILFVCNGVTELKCTCGKTLRRKSELTVEEIEEKIYSKGW